MKPGPPDDEAGVVTIGPRCSAKRASRKGRSDKENADN